jgi:hypothetical protein
MAATGVCRVWDVSFDNGASWTETTLDYPGTRLTSALWSHQWRPECEGDYVLTVRATTQDREPQKHDPERPFKSGATGFHKSVVHVSA